MLGLAEYLGTPLGGAFEHSAWRSILALRLAEHFSTPLNGALEHSAHGPLTQLLGGVQECSGDVVHARKWTPGSGRMWQSPPCMDERFWVKTVDKELCTSFRKSGGVEKTLRAVSGLGRAPNSDADKFEAKRVLALAVRRHMHDEKNKAAPMRRSCIKDYTKASTV